MPWHAAKGARDTATQYNAGSDMALRFHLFYTRRSILEISIASAETSSSSLTQPKRMDCQITLKHTDAFSCKAFNAGSSKSRADFSESLLLVGIGPSSKCYQDYMEVSSVVGASPVPSSFHTTISTAQKGLKAHQCTGAVHFEFLIVES